MTSSQTEYTKTTDFPGDFRKKWMVYALALSVLLHIGAALVFVIASGMHMSGNTPQKIIFQDLTFTPSISTRVKTEVIPSDTGPVIPAVNAPPTTEVTTSKLEPTPGQSFESSSSKEKTSELISTPLGLGMTHGFFSGLADGRSLRDDVRGYYFEMVDRINQDWWTKAGLLKESIRQDGVFELLVTRDGTIVSVQILQGTGSRDADRLLMEVIRNTSPLPPLPSSYGLDLFRAPLRIKAPSFLFR